MPDHWETPFDPEELAPEEPGLQPPDSLIEYDPNAESNMDSLKSAFPDLSKDKSMLGQLTGTGLVSWNTVPGGFTQLPQSIGQKKKLFQISRFDGGINHKSSPRDIGDNECQLAENISFSRKGALKILGDIKSTDNGITSHAITRTNRGSTGHGLFQFVSPRDNAGNLAETVFTLSSDGHDVDFHCVQSDGSTVSTGALIEFDGADDDDVAYTFYASGNAVYIADSNFTNTGSLRELYRYVYRKDYDSSGSASNLITSSWVGGFPLITSPVFDNTEFDASNAEDGRVNIQYIDSASTAFTATTVAGSATVHIRSDGAGSWDGDYFFYISWLFDEGCETQLTPLQASGKTGGYTFAEEALGFNFSVEDNNSSRNHIGGDARIEGARIYYKLSGTTERFLLAEVSLPLGVKGATDATYNPWDEGATDTFDLASDITISDPPNSATFYDLNSYYATETYPESPDVVGDGGGGVAGLEVRYKCAAVGQQGITYIGNVEFDGKSMPDTMMYSMPGKPGIFPRLNFFDSPSSDGSPIYALAAYGDTILQFRGNALFIINISTPDKPYAEAVYRDCGVHNQCQVFTASFGVIFANKSGCFIYDGERVLSLTAGKFDNSAYGIANNFHWELPNDINHAVGTVPSGSAVEGYGVPCVGYDPRSKSIIVLMDIGHTSTNTNGYVYDFTTQSWTKGVDMITNADGNRHTNFIITNNQPTLTGSYLSILRDDSTSLFNFNQGASATQAIKFWTKDYDFGAPSQTKKLFKVYITYKGDCSGLTVAYGVDGETDSANDLYHFSTASPGGTTATAPLVDADSGELVEKWQTATLYPDDVSEGKGWKSISLYFSGTVDDTFEIQDISILYRLRPIK